MTTTASRMTVEDPKSGDATIIMTRMFDAPIEKVWECFTRPEHVKVWFGGAGFANPVCEMDVRTGGGYSVTFKSDDSSPMTFFGKYLEVTPPSRLVWTNDEGDQGAVTTVTFEEEDGRTRLVLQELYPSKQALDEEGGSADGLPEQFEQLDELLATLVAGG